jgi:glucose/arabinose dehydrogenase
VTAADARPQALELPAHISPIDMRFYPGTAFPIAYRNALFIAFHGSARKTNGYSVARVVMTNGQPTGIEDFATGFLKDSLVLGRPAGLATGCDGALYVSDDSKGFIYRIAYRER